jgi:hypothetical protein
MALIAQLEVVIHVPPHEGNSIRIDVIARLAPSKSDNSTVRLHLKFSEAHRNNDHLFLFICNISNISSTEQ